MYKSKTYPEHIRVVTNYEFISECHRSQIPHQYLRLIAKSKLFTSSKRDRLYCLKQYFNYLVMFSILAYNSSDITMCFASVSIYVLQDYPLYLNNYLLYSAVAGRVSIMYIYSNDVTHQQCSREICSRYLLCS